MSTHGNLIAELAHEYLVAEKLRTPLEPLSGRYPHLTADHAYRVQMAIVEHKMLDGDTVVGLKVGASSKPIQQRFGLDEPIYGHLFASQQVAGGRTIALSGLIQPRIECEIAFRLGRDLAGPGMTIDNVLAATDGVVASLEINDPRTRDWRLGMVDLIADNGITARFVLSERLVPVAGLDLAGLRVVQRRNGDAIAEAAGAAVLGHPAAAVAWLANKLAVHGERLRAGQVVLAGSLTPIFPIQAGDRFEALFDVLGPVSAAFA